MKITKKNTRYFCQPFCSETLPSGILVFKILWLNVLGGSEWARVTRGDPCCSGGRWDVAPGLGPVGKSAVRLCPPPGAYLCFSCITLIGIDSAWFEFESLDGAAVGAEDFLEDSIFSGKPMRFAGDVEVVLVGGIGKSSKPEPGRDC